MSQERVTPKGEHEHVTLQALDCEYLNYSCRMGYVDGESG
jgi:hypothetical protein